MRGVASGRDHGMVTTAAAPATAARRGCTGGPTSGSPAASRPASPSTSRVRPRSIRVCFVAAVHRRRAGHRALRRVLDRAADRCRARAAGCRRGSSTSSRASPRWWRSAVVAHVPAAGGLVVPPTAGVSGRRTDLAAGVRPRAGTAAWRCPATPWSPAARAAAGPDAAAAGAALVVVGARARAGQGRLHRDPRRAARDARDRRRASRCSPGRGGCGWWRSSAPSAASASASQERADIAAHLHDSVLQTLALIQRNAGSPREVARLARGQERELRTCSTASARRSRPARRASCAPAAGEVEDAYAVAVDVVVVGDVALTTTSPRW